MAKKNYATQFLGKKVRVDIDRPLGSKHPKFDFKYKVNYGYIPNTMAPDGEEVDAYVIGIEAELKCFFGVCVAVINRLDDNDDKLVVVPEGVDFSDSYIMKQIKFQERFFNSQIIRN